MLSSSQNCVYEIVRRENVDAAWKDPEYAGLLTARLMIALVDNDTPLNEDHLGSGMREE